MKIIKKSLLAGLASLGITMGSSNAQQIDYPSQDQASSRIEFSENLSPVETVQQSSKALGWNTSDEVVEEVINSTVVISVHDPSNNLPGNGKGTGFFISPTHILTNKHTIVKDGNILAINVMNINGEEIRVKPNSVIMSPNSDLVVFEVEEPYSHFLRFSSSPYPQVGEEVISFGFGARNLSSKRYQDISGELALRGEKGVVEAPPVNIAHYGPISPIRISIDQSDSGSATLDNSGYISGIMTAFHERGGFSYQQRNTIYGLSIPQYRIIEFLDNNSIPYMFGNEEHRGEFFEVDLSKETIVSGLRQVGIDFRFNTYLTPELIAKIDEFAEVLLTRYPDGFSNLNSNRGIVLVIGPVHNDNSVISLDPENSSEQWLETVEGTINYEIMNSNFANFNIQVGIEQGHKSSDVIEKLNDLYSKLIQRFPDGIPGFNISMLSVSSRKQYFGEYSVLSLNPNHTSDQWLELIERYIEINMRKDEFSVQMEQLLKIPTNFNITSNNELLTKLNELYIRLIEEVANGTLIINETSYSRIVIGPFPGSDILSLNPNDSVEKWFEDIKKIFTQE